MDEFIIASEIEIDDINVIESIEKSINKKENKNSFEGKQDIKKNINGTKKKKKRK